MVYAAESIPDIDKSHMNLATCMKEITYVCFQTEHMLLEPVPWHGPFLLIRQALGANDPWQHARENHLHEEFIRDEEKRYRSPVIERKWVTSTLRDECYDCMFPIRRYTPT